MIEILRNKLILTTLNGRYHHTSLALRYLYANLDTTHIDCELLEFTIEDSLHFIVEKLLAQSPDYIGFSVAIWNASHTQEVLKVLKTVKPEIKIILGGPEFATQSKTHELARYADFIIEGEGEEILNEILKTKDECSKKIWTAPLLDLSKIKMPYDLYTAEDLKHRFVYVETTRGCPYKCAFCLSALAPQVRYFPLELLFQEFSKVIERGAKHFKFIDRTFNINSQRAIDILDYFLPHQDVFLHFEIVPEILTEEFIEKAAEFSEGRLQFEMGVQTLTPHVAKKIDRYLDLEKLEKNMRQVLTTTQAHIHADLIVGLPSEHFEEIKEGFNRLLKISPHEIQLGILKLLRGTPIEKHIADHKMKFSPLPPYEILENTELDYFTVQSFKRMSRYLDLLLNHGSFPHLKNYIQTLEDPFSFFWCFSSFAFEKHPQSNGISLKNLKVLLEEFLKTKALSEEQITEITSLASNKARETKTQHNSRQIKHSSKG